jgi:hypothetical protein
MPGKRRVRDPYADQETARYKTPPVPLVIDDDEVTVPVDVGEMEAAAAASRRPGDPSKRPHVVARSRAADAGAASADPRALMAEVQVSGTAQVVLLRVRNVSPTGFCVEIPGEVDLRVRAGAAVMVRLQRSSEERDRLPGGRLRAHVTHRRHGTHGKTGGMSLRWDLDEHQSCASLEEVIRSVKGA